MSLRWRLVLGLLVLAGCGLLVADVATYTSLRSFLLNRVDSTLESDHAAVERALAHGHGPLSCAGIRDVDPTVFVQLRTRAGTPVCTRLSADLAKLEAPEDRSGPPPDDLPKRPAPELAANLSLPKGGGPAANRDRPRFFDAAAVSGSARYRVRAAVEPEISGVAPVLVVARPLHDVEETLDRLLLIEGVVTAAVLLAIALLGLWTVRLGLRPLEAIARTADAIRAGDLSRRVERAEPRTEVGRLGLALNAMLGEIESSNQRLRRFVADASHELRTPLAAVRAYAELFGRGADRRPDDLARAMSGIGRESERMSVLVDDLLLLARLDEHRPLERTPVRLDLIAGEAVDAARTVEPERPLELEVEPATVLGDSHRLRQVLDNLLANVRSHTPARSPATVRVTATDGHVTLEVADTGPGLSPEEAERVFERFYRADVSRSRASGGVGLGLAIVEAVAEAHDGTVSVVSEPGRGTTFRIVLPLAADGVIEARPAAGRAPMRAI